MNEPEKLTQEEAEQKAIEMAAKTFGLDLECLMVIPDPAGWVIKDRCTGERYVVPAKFQADLGFPVVKPALEVGKIYWVAGKGPMKLSELPHPARPKADERGMIVLDPEKTTITMVTSKGYNHWVSEDEIQKPMTAEGMRDYREEVNRKAPDAESAVNLAWWLNELAGGEPRCVSCQEEIEPGQVRCEDTPACMKRIERRLVAEEAKRPPKRDDSWKIG
jgi:hypothetical protein